MRSEAFTSYLASASSQLAIPTSVLWSLDKDVIASYQRLRRSVNVTQRKRERIETEIDEYNERLLRETLELEDLGSDIAAEFADVEHVRNPQVLRLVTNSLV